MCKKIGILSLAVLAGVIVWNKTSMGSYAKFAWHKVRGEVKNQMPLEWEIDRLRGEVTNLIPDMKRQFSKVAEEEVAIEKLRKEIEVARANLKERQEEICQMRQDVRLGKEYISYMSVKYSTEKIKEKLAKDWESFQRAEAALKTREEILAARESSLTAAKTRLSEVKSKKEQLDLKVAQLEAELKNLRLAQSRCQFHFDDSQLSRCQEMINDLDSRIQAEKKTAELEAQFSTDQIPVREKVKTEKALKEIDARFGDIHSQEKVVVDGN